ncbi:hypothetical protein AC579_1234 [Pseudocercospora musae]|uniref:Uncharacterized protein n=1 Tax=Pseudocercospora musae TaxID=113226 RepID=A0A139I5H5_9PEZI|nr:hypothetical protein AC579_1234 [Pseudocercospora musae]
MLCRSILEIAKHIRRAGAYHQLPTCRAALFTGGHTTQQRCMSGSGKGKQLRCRREHEELASESTIAARAEGKHGSFFGTVAVANLAAQTNIEQLISQVQPLRCGIPADKTRHPSQLTLLLTPSFAKHAADAELPIRVLDRFHSHAAVDKPIDAITAVVDRLPIPNGSEHGCEGIAYAFITDPKPLDVESQAALHRDTTKPGSLCFHIPPHRRSRRLCHTKIQLPLAQTVFSTGLPSTLIHNHYEPSSEDGRQRLVQTRNLESQSVRLAVRGLSQSLSYGAPLVPLTPFRLIQSSMGNIVRTLAPATATEHRFIFDLKGDKVGYDKNTGEHNSQNGRAFPASQELEAAVQDYFKKLEIAPEPVQVWALVFPSLGKTGNDEDNSLAQITALDREDIRSLWSPAPQQNTQSAEKSPTDFTENHQAEWRRPQYFPMLLLGARFIKVLSGGGGWGKKAGLLSFDPDSSYSTREIRSETGWNFSLDDEEALQESQKQVLGEVVKEGELVAFFIAPSENANTARKQGLFNEASPDEPALQNAVTFGAVPSSLESALGRSAVSHDSDGNQGSIKHFVNHFGALSEGGMAVTLTKGGTVVTQTKMDMPFGKFRLELWSGASEKKAAEQCLVGQQDEDRMEFETAEQNEDRIEFERAERMVLGPYFREHGFLAPRNLAYSKLRILRLAQDTAEIAKNFRRRLGGKKYCETLLQRQQRLREVPWADLDKTQQLRAWGEINRTFTEELADRSTPNDMGFQVRPFSQPLIQKYRIVNPVESGLSEDAWQELSGHGDLKIDTKQNGTFRDAIHGGGRTSADVVEDFVTAGGTSAESKPRQKSTGREEVTGYRPF